MKYEVVMGLEVHVELATASKLFCACSARFGADANENVCPACAGMPGMLPVANRQAIEFGIAAGLVTNCEITRRTTFDKKNYFYPDLATGYQITQYFAPICRNGYVDIETSQGPRRIRIKQIHVEEDAGKLVHDNRTGSSLVDYNRAGVPLTEVVSMPDFRTAEEVIAYLEALRALLTFAGVSDCKMQEGSMRADINISVREQGATTLGTRTEMKNMNSLKAIARAIAYESQRHIEALETGCEVLVQETRRWDDEAGESYAMRNKENATDYRYFPNPDIMPIEITDAWIDAVRVRLPEPAHKKLIRLRDELGLPETDARIITGSKNLSDIFDQTMRHLDKPRDIANWILVELLALAKADNLDEDEIQINAEKFAKVLALLDANTISRNVAKTVLAQVFRADVDPEAYIEQHKLGLVSDDGALRTAIEEALAANPKSVAEFREGNPKVHGFLLGQVMRKTGGKADPKRVGALLQEMLEALKS